jgi:microcystin-dependent protein
MSSPYIGEIRMFGGNFAPAGWALCAGQLVPISENDTLFNLIGTTYGGDGQETFGLPDLRGRVLVHQGTYLGNTFVMGQMGGTESVTINASQLPAHSHAAMASLDAGTQPTVEGSVPASSNVVKIYAAGGANSPMATQMIGPVGGSQPHENMQPFLCINFIISLYGIYPTQN